MVRSLYSKLRYLLLLVKLFVVFIRSLRKQGALQKTTQQSLDIYQQYDDREQIDYASRQEVMFFQGRFQRMSFKDARENYLKYLYAHVDAWRKGHPGQTLRILEVGCGNCINLISLRRKYGDSVEITGIDISPERIRVAKAYFGEALQDTSLLACSLTAGLPFPDATFDLVFSMHCIEQIAYETRLAVVEMLRLTRWRVAFVEPIFENGNMAQKLYLIISDHCRILLRTVVELGCCIVENQALDIQSNPVNQSSILVVEKGNPSSRQVSSAGKTATLPAEPT